MAGCRPHPGEGWIASPTPHPARPAVCLEAVVKCISGLQVAWLARLTSLSARQQILRKEQLLDAPVPEDNLDRRM